MDVILNGSVGNERTDEWNLDLDDSRITERCALQLESPNNIRIFLKIFENKLKIEFVIFSNGGTF